MPNMNKLLSLFIILFLIVASPLVAQKKAFKKANKKFKRGEYEVAIGAFQSLLNKGSYKAEVNYKIAESYRLSHRIAQALPYYQAAISSNINEEGATVYYAYALKANEKYDEAEKTLSAYLDKGTDKKLRKLAENEYNNLRNLSDIRERNSYYRVKNLDAINTKDTEYAPVYNGGELFFTSNRDHGKIYKATGTSFTNIYKAKTQGAKVDVSTIEMLGGEINSPKMNDGCVTFSKDGRTMLFAKGNTGRKKGTDEVKLYISRFRKGEWTEPKMLNISTVGVWDSSPVFARNGKTVYFSSYNRKGSYGGTDIYKATLSARGKFVGVKNLGSAINTPGDDMFPYVADDGKLYFASDGHPGLGGLDLFVAERKDGKTNVRNLGSPVNSVADDFGLFLFSQTKGFFTSNRKGGKGDDDIYTFINNDPNLKVVNYFLSGTTLTDDSLGAEVILPNTKIKLYGNNNELIEETITGASGTFKFRVYEGENYQLIGEKQAYFTTRVDFSMIGNSIPQEDLVKMVTNKEFKTKINLDRIVLDKSIVLDNIFYDFAKWNIREDASIELDKLVNVLKDNPEINIELSSHTDSVDTDEYNQRLSQKRAESAVEYIVASGIKSTRITAKGYGEVRPIARNTNPDGTDNPEGRQKNRRTEFKVTSINKSTKIIKNKTDDGVLDDDDIDFDEELNDDN